MTMTNGNSKRKNGRRKRWPWILGILVVMGVTGSKFMMRPKPDDTKTASVTRQDIRQTVTATGSVTLQTSAEVKIGAEVSGKVKRLYVDVGDSVHAGQLIAELQNAESDAMLAQSRASVESAGARVRQAEASLRQQRPSTAATIARARGEVRAAEARYRQAILSSDSQPGLTKASIDNANAELSISRDALVQAKASASLQVQTAQAALNAAKAQSEQSAANARRARNLVDQGYISTSEAETAETQAVVSASDVIAKQKALALADANAKNDVSAAEQRLRKAQAGLQSAKAGASEVGVRAAQADAAREDLANARQSLAAALAGQEDVTVRTAQTEESRAALRQATAEYDRQRNNYGKMRIFSPIDGIVTTVEAKEGETVTAGFQTPTLLTIANLNRTQVDVPVDETDIGTLKVGQQAEVTVDAFPNRTLSGRVVKVASDTIVNANVVSYNCTIAIDRTDVPLKPKMTAKVKVDTGLVRDAVVVPLDALKTAKDNDVVYLEPEKTKGRGKPGKFKEVIVKTGASDDKVIQIVSGLKEGQKVVLSSKRLEAQRQMEAQRP